MNTAYVCIYSGCIYSSVANGLTQTGDYEDVQGNVNQYK